MLDPIAVYGTEILTITFGTRFELTKLKSMFRALNPTIDAYYANIEFICHPAIADCDSG
jgi:hypothetical protein